jgi:hypothetical protein
MAKMERIQWSVLENKKQIRNTSQRNKWQGYTGGGIKCLRGVIVLCWMITRTWAPVPSRVRKGHSRENVGGISHMYVHYFFLPLFKANIQITPIGITSNINNIISFRNSGYLPWINVPIRACSAGKAIDHVDKTPKVAHCVECLEYFLRGPSTIIEFWRSAHPLRIVSLKIPYEIVHPELLHKNEKGWGDEKSRFLRLEKYTDRMVFEQMKTNRLARTKKIFIANSDSLIFLQR